MRISNSSKRFLSAMGSCIGGRDGFTLLELVVALLIAVVVMATAGLSLLSIVRHHAPEELVSELHLARMSAIRQHRPVTVTFNFNTTQCTVSWNGGANTKTIDLGQRGERFQFDTNPPGAPQPADNAFIFSPLGFISTNPGGNVGGNIYLTNKNINRAAGQNDRAQYQIQTTIAGGINLNRYNPATNAWDRTN